MIDDIDNKTYKDFNDFMSCKVVPGLILIADKHNYDRDDFIEFAAAAMTMISEMATFKYYKLPDMGSEVQK